MLDNTTSWFLVFSRKLSNLTGRPTTFIAAVLTVLVWAVLGPYFHFSDTWQLVINTSPTIVTFQMVFLIQNTQNRDTKQKKNQKQKTQNRDTTAKQIKLDELIRAVKGAQNSMLNIEELDDATLELFRARYEKLAVAARKKLEHS